MGLAIPNEFGYVVAGIGCMAIPCGYGAYKVIKARKKYGVHCTCDGANA
jgi:hypothetical protein